MLAAIWVEVCHAEDLDREDVLRFDYGERTFAVYRTAKNEYYATDGFCTHQNVHLAGGLVIGNQIECPKHNGRLDFTTGEPKRTPVCKNIATYPAKVEGGKVFIQIME